MMKLYTKSKFRVITDYGIVDLNIEKCLDPDEESDIIIENIIDSNLLSYSKLLIIKSVINDDYEIGQTQETLNKDLTIIIENMIGDRQHKITVLRGLTGCKTYEAITWLQKYELENQPSPLKEAADELISESKSMYW